MELRFVEREEPDSWDGAFNVTSVKKTKVLQFRTRNKNYPVQGWCECEVKEWSEWQDVPLVKEDD